MKSNDSRSSSRSSSSRSRATLNLVAVLALGLAVAAYQTHGTLPRYPPGPRAPEKLGYESFSKYYVKYRSDHAHPYTLFFHVVSWLLMVLAILRRPRYLVSLTLTLAMGYMVSEVTCALATGLVEGLVMAVVFVSSNLLLTRRAGLEVPLLGYLLAVPCHFILEGNLPNSLVLPTYSMFSDFMQVLDVARGTLPLVVPPIPGLTH